MLLCRRGIAWMVRLWRLQRPQLQQQAAQQQQQQEQEVVAVVRVPVRRHLEPSQ
jgi:hypothetical protein